MSTTPENSNEAPNSQDLRNLLAAIVDSSDDAIIAKALDGTITAWNLGAERMYGYQASEAIGRHISLVTPPDCLADLTEILARIARGERIERHETRRLCKNGAVLDVSLTISPIHDATGKIVGASAIGRDVTYQLALEEGRDALERRIRQSERLESLGQLAGGIAHDFNNLLAVILSFARFTAKEIVDDPERASADVEKVIMAAERASTLTRQLLRFSRSEVQQAKVVDLNDLVLEIERLLRRTIGTHIELVTSPLEDLWSVEADPGQIQQVLLNLAVNARDAMPNGGSLFIDTENVEIDSEYATLHPGLVAGRFVQLRVSDTGTGMDRSVLEHIFEPFFTTKPQGEGTGLGLATVFGIVTQAGGQVEFYSEPGFGTTCRVLLPTTDRVAAVVVPQSATEDFRGHETVLVVEDEDDLREVTQRILEENGYRVLTSANGLEALDTADHHRGEIDLLLTDVVMPGMLGKEVAERVLAIRPGTSVLYMSGYAQGVLASRGTLDSEMTLVDKPFSESQLLAKVRKSLDARELPRPI